MRIGLLARADNRGVGVQTWELYRHLKPDVTVLVSMKHVRYHGGGVEYPDRYPDALTVYYLIDGSLGFEPYGEALAALGTCDVVLTVETPYDWRLLVDLPRRDTKTVVVGNREFLEWLVKPKLPRPDLFIAPSTWLLDDWPLNTVYLPHPVDRERLPFTRRTRAREFLHLAAPAMMDRAGTRMVLGASRFATGHVFIRSQDMLNVTVTKPRQVEVFVQDTENYWEAYTRGDVLLAPRRYGGQSLPVNEALSLGMPVIALDREPERQMLPPECLVPAQLVHPVAASGGEVECYDADPQLLSQKMDLLYRDDELVTYLSDDADRRAEELSWEVLKPRWLKTLSEA